MQQSGGRQPSSARRPPYGRTVHFPSVCLDVVQWNFGHPTAIAKGPEARHCLFRLSRRETHTGAGVRCTAYVKNYLALGSALQSLVPNPFSGLVSTGALSTPTIQQRQLLLPYPQFTGVTVINDTSGNSIYHALNVKAEQHLRSGFTFLVSFSASKLISDVPSSTTTYDNPTNAGLATSVQDPYNLRAERSVSELDIPRSLSVNGIYELPFGPGKAFLSHSNGLILDACGRLASSVRC